jgi:hypothetical protein
MERFTRSLSPPCPRLFAASREAWTTCSASGR